MAVAVLRSLRIEREPRRGEVTIRTATASGPGYALEMLDDEVLVDQPRIWQRS
jgi:hypothetical protein